MAAPARISMNGDARLSDRTADERRALDYNFEHFRTRHLVQDGLNTLKAAGIPPGAAAPDFVLPDIAGGTFRLGSLIGTPVLLRFGSRT